MKTEQNLTLESERGFSDTLGSVSKSVSSNPGNTRHGHSRPMSPTYVSWQKMKSRCRDKSRHNYKHYGGRGICVCERWQKFENFLYDMGERPVGMFLDRIDNDGNYEPMNCQWATRSENERNKRPEHIHERNTRFDRWRSARRGLNARPVAWEATALPTELLAQ